MICFLEGRLVEALPTRVVLDIQGIGYEVLVPLSTFEKLPGVGQGIKLLTHFHVREDEHILFGFATAEERDLFKLLITHVSGIGPKLALNVLSGCAPSQLRAAITAGDGAFLSRIKGIGKKTAERMIVELRDKVGMEGAWTSTSAKTLTPDQQVQHDALLALLALGYRQADGVKALQSVGPFPSVSEWVREALKQI